MRKYILIFVFIGLSYFSIAQTAKVTSFSLTELGPGFEMPVTSTITAKLQLGFMGSIEPLITDAGTFDFSLAVKGFSTGSMRYYYNFGKRDDKRKNISKNSANYVAVSNMYLTSPILSIGTLCECLSENSLTSGLVWGIQRNYDSRISLDINVGLGYNFNLKSVSPMSTLTFGLWLGRKE